MSEATATVAGNTVDRTAPPVLSVRDVSRSYATGRKRYDVVQGVSFDVWAGETLGVVGESGCGKSTLARAVMRIGETTSGSIELGGTDLTTLRGAALRRERRRLQMVFQDPFGSLDPRMSVLALVEQPLAVHGTAAGERRRRATELLADVGLGEQFLDRRPGELSGGQCQRVAIARALVLQPELTVLDEPISALDVSVQAQVLTLLRREQRRLGLTYLFIVHDLAAAEYFCDRVLVLYLGKVVETGTSEDLFRRPLHPYTTSLLSAAPDPRRSGAKQRVLLRGEPQSRRPETGCPFAARCPVGFDRPVCRERAPELRALDGADTATGTAQQVACHFPGELEAVR
ncbi:oligopeptide/dipeptide ABC transporter ATP-binding protein [Kineococcus sp. SYSU DK003]|uniref:oligopeptide/dipeptide ABC transporter ATP-binding protein n=1 Tax=Kineococcus sp. SYSU DK003 TaxID=3383124 RepID=UPI003D7E8C7A